MATCSIDSCNKIIFATGWCTTHYDRNRRNGNPLVLKHCVGIGDTQGERFWSRVKKDTNEKGCWEWLGVPSDSGYASTTWNGTLTSVHRISYEIANGVKPVGFVLHSCDNSVCVNPKHLREGTQQENIQDAVIRNRNPKGENHGNAIITDNTARQIKRLIAEKVKVSHIAKQLDVSYYVAWGIKSGRTWRHV